jgi:general secretion pathway protein I
MPAPSRHPGGQALLETLVAVAILAIALVSLLAGLVRLQDQRLEAARARHAAGLAEARMADLLLAGQGAFKNASGNFPAPDEAYTFAVEVTELAGDVLQLVSVTVGSAGSERVQVRLSRLEPKP